jgi:ABC-type sugar transport system, periplasmic component
MKSISKRVTALLISMLLAMSMLSGCKKENTSATEETEVTPNITEAAAGADTSSGTTNDFSEHMDISLAFWDAEANLKGTENDEVLKAMEDKFNVTFVPQNITWDDFTQKIQLWAASGSLPDLFAGGFRTTGSFARWANEGLLTEIPSDLSAYPNLQKYLDSKELPSCQVNGKTYCIFRQTYAEQAETVKDRTIAYRWDLAQKAGITKEPTNWDEFRTMLQAIIAADPEGKDIQGLTSVGYVQLGGVFFPYSMPLADVGGVTFYWVDKGDGTYIPAYFAGDKFGSDAIPTWNLLRAMYQEGSIEPDIALTTVPQAKEKFLQGQSAAIVYNTQTGGIWSEVYKYWPDIYGHDATEDVKILDLMPSVDGSKNYCIWDYAWSESYISAAVDDAKLNRILAIYDYLLSDEGILLSKCGIEGKTYEKDAEGKITYINNKVPTDTYKSINVFAYLACWNYNTLSDSLFPGTVPSIYLEKDKERVEEARKITVPKYNYDCTTAYVGMGKDFSINQQEDMLNIMTGTDPVEDMWQQIIDNYKEQGLDDIIKQVNAAVKNQ